MSESTISLIGFVAGTCTVVSFLPQVVHTLKTKKTKDLSLGMYIILLAGAVLWTSYGVLTHAPSILYNQYSDSFSRINYSNS